MFIRVSAPLLASILAFSPVLAEDAVDPAREAVLARGQVMSDMGKALRTLQLGLRQGADIATLLLAAETVDMNAQLIGNVFQTEAHAEGSEALPAIWQNWDDFSQKAAAAAELSAMLAEAVDNEDLKAAGDLSRKLTAACAACHDVYRGKPDGVAPAQ